MKEFMEFRKIPRLSRDCVITEKIDGTNASIYIGEDGEFLTGSRTRWITPAMDNHGFAKWAMKNKEELLKLGAGHHFGEWWGYGIQRGYGLPKEDKRFSLFNVTRWCLSDEEPKLISIDPATKKEKFQDKLPACCGLVPVLWKGEFDTFMIISTLSDLMITGSIASPGFLNPEGIVIFHTAANIYFKKTIFNDETPKSSIAERI